MTIQTGSSVGELLTQLCRFSVYVGSTVLDYIGLFIGTIPDFVFVNCDAGPRDSTDNPTLIRYTSANQFKARILEWKAKYAKPTAVANITADDFVAQACCNVGASPPTVEDSDMEDEWTEIESKADERKVVKYGCLNSNATKAVQNITDDRVIDSLLIGNKHNHKCAAFLLTN